MSLFLQIAAEFCRILSVPEANVLSFNEKWKHTVSGILNLGQAEMNLGSKKMSIVSKEFPSEIDKLESEG